MRSPRFSSFAVSAVVSLALMVGTVSTAGAASTPVAPPTSGFYLDLGASASVGFQPTLTRPHGRPTSFGYANDLVAYEAARGVTLQLTQLGCPGETTTTMLYGGDHCLAPGQTQLMEAMAFLATHRGEPGIVTIDLGFNNFLPCFLHLTVDPTCAATKLADVRAQMPVILYDLRSVAGPAVTFVGLGHFDPYLAYGLEGHSSTGFPATSYDVIAQLNAVLHDAFSAANVAMAMVASSFKNHDRTKVPMPGEGMVPLNVERTCAYTWMCHSRPYGPNFHPDTAGYARIASAIEAVLPRPWS